MMREKAVCLTPSFFKSTRVKGGIALEYRTVAKASSDEFVEKNQDLSAILSPSQLRMRRSPL